MRVHTSPPQENPHCQANCYPLWVRKARTLTPESFPKSEELMRVSRGREHCSLQDSGQMCPPPGPPFLRAQQKKVSLGLLSTTNPWGEPARWEALEGEKGFSGRSRVSGGRSSDRVGGCGQQEVATDAIVREPPA